MLRFMNKTMYQEDDTEAARNGTVSAEPPQEGGGPTPVGNALPGVPPQ